MGLRGLLFKRDTTEELGNCPGTPAWQPWNDHVESSSGLRPLGLGSDPTLSFISGTCAQRHPGHALREKPRAGEARAARAPAAASGPAGAARTVARGSPRRGSAQCRRPPHKPRAASFPGARRGRPLVRAAQLSPARRLPRPRRGLCDAPGKAPRVPPAAVTPQAGGGRGSVGARIRRPELPNPLREQQPVPRWEHCASLPPSRRLLAAATARGDLICLVPSACSRPFRCPSSSP